MNHRLDDAVVAGGDALVEARHAARLVNTANAAPRAGAFEADGEKGQNSLGTELDSI